MSASIFVGTAGWAIPARLRNDFPSALSLLESYAQVFRGVEINSSFYRDHKPETYARWSRCVPADFRFSVKLSRAFTQQGRLKETGARLRDTLETIAALGMKWGVLLVQLPPTLEFARGDAGRFLSALRGIYSGPIAWEPRHASWATDLALDLLIAHGATKVIADPEPCALTEKQERRMRGLAYYRLHGSPEIYRSKYPEEFVQHISARLAHSASEGRTSWCVYDNTTFGFATEDALATCRDLEAAAAA